MTHIINRNLSSDIVLSCFLQILVAQRVISDEQAHQLVDAFNQHGVSGLLANLDFLFPVDDTEPQPSELRPSDPQPIRVAIGDTVALTPYFVHPDIKFGRPYTVKEVLSNGDIRVNGSFGECTMVRGSYEVLARAERAQVGDVVRGLRGHTFTVTHVDDVSVSARHNDYVVGSACHGMYTIVKRADASEDRKCPECGETMNLRVKVGGTDWGWACENQIHAKDAHAPGDIITISEPELYLPETYEHIKELFAQGYRAVGPVKNENGIVQCLFLRDYDKWIFGYTGVLRTETYEELLKLGLPPARELEGPVTLDEQGNAIPYTGELIPLLPQASTDLLAATLAKRDGIKHITIANGKPYSVNYCPTDGWAMRDYGDGPATILVVPGESE